MSDIKNIEPCPFCGSVLITTEMDQLQGTKWGYAICGECLSCGPEVRTGYDKSDNAPWRKYAIEEWNQRTKGEEK